MRVSLGGVRDESDVMSARKTYIGSHAGQNHQRLKQAGVKNPLVLMDGKLIAGHQLSEDPSSALARCLDSRTRTGHSMTIISTCPLI